MFFLRGVNEKNLKVYEGQGYVVVDPKNGAENPNFSDLTKEIIGDFNRAKV